MVRLPHHSTDGTKGGRSHGAALSIEDQLAELRAMCVGLYDMICDQQAETKAEIARLQDADAQTQRTVRELQAALTAHLPTAAAHLSVQAAHRPVPGSQPPEPERERKQDTTSTV
jgi:hypothetical protein